MQAWQRLTDEDEKALEVWEEQQGAYGAVLEGGGDEGDAERAAFGVVKALLPEALAKAVEELRGKAAVEPADASERPGRRRHRHQGGLP